MTLYRQRAAKTGKTADALAEFLRVHDLKIDEDSEEPVVDSSVVLLTVVRELRDITLQYNPVKISIVLENEVVINLQRLSDAFPLMFGLIYALDLSYPKEMANTFDFIQKVLLGLDDGKLKPRVLALKSDLLINAQ